MLITPTCLHSRDLKHGLHTHELYNVLDDVKLLIFRDNVTEMLLRFLSLTYNQAKVYIICAKNH